MEITKNDIVKRAAEELRISGITVNVTPEEATSFLGRLDELAASLAQDGLDAGYLFPDEYGQSDPNEDSGLELWMVRPFAMLLANDAASSYGPEKAMAVNQVKVDQAMDTLANGLVEIAGSKYPDTLPVGASNECLGADTYFYDGSQPSEG